MLTYIKSAEEDHVKDIVHHAWCSNMQALNTDGAPAKLLHSCVPHTNCRCHFTLANNEVTVVASAHVPAAAHGCVVKILKKKKWTVINATMLSCSSSDHGRVQHGQERTQVSAQHMLH